MTCPPLKSLSLLAALSAATLLPGALCAQDAEPAGQEPVKISPADAQKVIEKLDELRKMREQMRLSAMQAGIQRIQEALSTELGPVELYKDCIKAERFTGQTDSMNSEFREWKENSEEHLKDSRFRKCLRTHLQYLALSLEYLAIQEKEPQLILPKLSNYLASLEQLEIPTGGRNNPAGDLMSKPLSQSVFVQNLDLGTEINRLKGWEQTAGNFTGIEEVTVLPLLREHHKDQLMAFWDRKIGRESKLASEAALASNADNFRNRRLPNLEWQRAQDMLLVGKGEGAYKEMFRIVSTNPGHPEFNKWATTLENYIKASLPPAPPAAADATKTTTDTSAGS